MSEVESSVGAGAATGERILAALVEVILEGGLPGFSVQEVADRAGVTHRTVYRHFPTREALLEGLVEQVDRRMAERGGINDIEALDDLPAAALVNFALFSQDRRSLAAAIRFGVGAAIDTVDRVQRSKMVQAQVADALPGLAADDVAMASAMLRQIVGSRTWLGFMEAGLSDEDAARAAGWAAAVLIDALRNGRTPSTEALGHVREPAVDPPSASPPAPAH